MPTSRRGREPALHTVLCRRSNHGPRQRPSHSRRLGRGLRRPEVPDRIRSELRRAGRQTWNSEALRTHGSIGRLLFNVRDQFLATFGSVGHCARNYPVRIVVEQPLPNQLSVQITMRGDFEPCYPFHAVLAGQMESLPTIFGLRNATVEIHPNADGASFLITYTERGYLASIHWRSAIANEVTFP